MKINVTQDIVVDLDFKELGFMKAINKRKSKIENLESEINDISDDITNAQNLLLLYSLDNLKKRGFKEGVEVIYTPTNTKHIIDAFFLDRENNIMAVILNPIPKLKLFAMPYVYQLDLIAKKKKAKV